MISQSKIKDILEELGYQLSDKGSYWQCAALYRNGDNKTALQIYKDTGAWKDYVANTPFMPFKQLLVLTLNSNDPKDLEKYLSKEETFFLKERAHSQNDKLYMEEVYPEDCLKKLLPHYKFYNSRGISNDVLQKLKGGLATKSQMYQRFVFPIYNQYGQIHGFSGRDMSGKEGRPKWKHIGKKNNWVYPAYVKQKSGILLDDYTDEYVIIVESIGDCLNLMQNGFNNVLVSFGLDISSKLLCSIVQFNFKSVILSYNNDNQSKENRGMNAAIKNYLKLLTYFDPNAVKICLPVKNDFGEMNSEDFTTWKDKLKKAQSSNQVDKIIEASNKLKSKRQLSKPLLKNLKLIS
jgi:major membrane immunogen (membrane-anchored lipoprotein)